MQNKHIGYSTTRNFFAFTLQSNVDNITVAIEHWPFIAGNPDLLKEMILAISHHVTGNHEFPDNTHHKVGHYFFPQGWLNSVPIMV
jgi:hypothetical protein